MRTESQGWRLRAVCAAPGIDPETFFPIDTGPAGALAVTAAKRVCGGCPVRVECLADVMASEDPAERFGVCGGLSAAERTALFTRDRHPTPQAAPTPPPLVAPALVSVVVGVQLDLFDLLDTTTAVTARKGAA